MFLKDRPSRDKILIYFLTVLTPIAMVYVHLNNRHEELERKTDQNIRMVQQISNDQYETAVRILKDIKQSVQLTEHQVKEIYVKQVKHYEIKAGNYNQKFEHVTYKKCKANPGNPACTPDGNVRVVEAGE